MINDTVASLKAELERVSDYLVRTRALKATGHGGLDLHTDYAERRLEALDQHIAEARQGGNMKAAFRPFAARY